MDLLPGPVTVIVKRRKHAPLAAELNPGVDSIGIRVPDNDFIREVRGGTRIRGTEGDGTAARDPNAIPQVCRQHDGAIALTSANLSGGTSPLEVSEFQELWPALASVFDEGPLAPNRAGSTIVDLTEPGSFKIVRDGSALGMVLELLQDKHKLRRRQ